MHAAGEIEIVTPRERPELERARRGNIQRELDFLESQADLTEDELRMRRDRRSLCTRDQARPQRPGPRAGNTPLRAACSVRPRSNVGYSPLRIAELALRFLPQRMQSMKASPSRGTCRSGAGHGAHLARPLVALGLIAMAFQVAAQGDTPAVLKRQQVDFFYRSSAVPLSCYDLQGRVAAVLRALGARDDVEVDVDGCDAVVSPMEEPDFTWQNQNPSDRWGSSSDRWRTSSDRYGTRRTRREQSSHVRISLMMPVEVTQGVLDEIKKDKSRRELVSRVTGNPAASLDDPIIFPAQRQQVTLSRRTVDLEPEDCELLEQMSMGIFKDLGIRVVRPGPRCDRHEVSRIPPQLTVEALMPVMPSTPQLGPPSGPTDPSAPAGSETETQQQSPTPPQR